ncbi:MAG TPA: DUF1566 domain-containing protein [Thermodesulfobacteriota bacterium]|nr:DUF1566 domain-containing protein [Thermodesulfobacteriota bacterium]
MKKISNFVFWRKPERKAIRFLDVIFALTLAAFNLVMKTKKKAEWDERIIKQSNKQWGDIIECMAIRPMIFIGLALVIGLLPSAAGAKGSPALNACQASLNTCNADLATCEGDLAASDGFVDNGDGTVTDVRSGLMWEMKTGTVGSSVICTSAAVCPDPHNVNNVYDWADTNFAVFVRQLNNTCDGDPTITCDSDPACGVGDCCGFACHRDWRIPEVGREPGSIELEGILSFAQGSCGDGIGACISPVFGPTAASSYWSAMTCALDTSFAFGVSFFNGFVFCNNKFTDFVSARAVR